MKRLLLLPLLILAGVCCATTMPLAGSFDLDASVPEVIHFDTAPWQSLDSSYSAMIKPYATENPLTAYPGVSGFTRHLGSVMFAGGDVIVWDGNTASGDMGILIQSGSGVAMSLAACEMTLEFAGESFTVYLPIIELGDFNSGLRDMHLWVGADGSTWYSNRLANHLGDPAIDAETSIGEGRLAAVPEPASLLLLGLGAMAIRRKS
jgi:hypothetical protein